VRFRCDCPDPIHHPPRAIAAELGPITIPAEPLDTSVAAEQKSAG
jgi:hypothetical protein